MLKIHTDLIGLPGFSFPVYMSRGVEQRSREIATRCEGAYRFFASTFNANAQINILVLAPKHWAHYTSYPVYGMPHFIDSQTLLVAGENNGFWKSMTPPIEALPASAAHATFAVYGLPDGSVDFSSFFDLLAIHEMAHLFHLQASVELPRFWLKEFFCNLALHAYVVADAPDQLPALETFPQLVVEGGHSHLAYHTLADFEHFYTGMEPQNYGWYQCKFHVAAKHTYEAGGVDILRRLWSSFLHFDKVWLEEQLAIYLSERVDPVIARILAEWPT